jgi:hypothetical protein
METIIVLPYKAIIYTISVLVLTAAGATDRFTLVLKLINRWTPAY